MMSLPVTRATTTPSTIMACSAMNRGSSSIPTATKKSVAKRSRRGMISARTWLSNSDSETTIPARNAPSANDSPASLLAKAVPRAISTTVSKKSSRDPVRATANKIRGTSLVPRTTTAIRAIAAIPSDRSSARKGFPRSSVSSGSRASIGTRLRSWMMPSPRATLAWGLSASPRPSSSLRATIELEMAKAPPSRRAASMDHPIASPTTMPSAPVIGIWMPPATKATRRTRRSSARENSTPSANMRKATPRLARTSTRS